MSNGIKAARAPFYKRPNMSLPPGNISFKPPLKDSPKPLIPLPTPLSALSVCLPMNFVAFAAALAGAEIGAKAIYPVNLAVSFPI